MFGVGVGGSYSIGDHYITYSIGLLFHRALPSRLAARNSIIIVYIYIYIYIHVAIRTNIVDMSYCY